MVFLCQLHLAFPIILSLNFKFNIDLKKIHQKQSADWKLQGHPERMLKVNKLCKSQFLQKNKFSQLFLEEK